MLTSYIKTRWKIRRHMEKVNLKLNSIDVYLKQTRTIPVITTSEASSHGLAGICSTNHMNNLTD